VKSLTRIVTSLGTTGLFLSLLLARGAEQLAEHPDIPAPTNAVLIYADGSILCPATLLTFALVSDSKPRSVRYRFGLPANPPQRRSLEADEVPVYQTSWDQDGIHYVQKVLLTCLGMNDPALANMTNLDAVLLIQLYGENKAADYTTAQAEFVMERDSLPARLELREGRVYAMDVNPPALVALVDVPVTGIGTTNGTRLQFQGHMPPGTTGTMTIKIPVAQPVGREALERLRDLEFDEEVQRLKRAWRSHSGKPRVPSITWADRPLPQP
jgi:hypothetical protein